VAAPSRVIFRDVLDEFIRFLSEPADITTFFAASDTHKHFVRTLAALGVTDKSKPLNKGVIMATRKVSIGSSVGLHARPASLFVQAATATGLPVLIAKGEGVPVDAGSILMVMTLGAKHGDVVTLSAEGDGADEALDSLVGLLARDLDAE
jgi:phosphocarrier protein